jgi:hydroxymethylbilane synthase
VSSSIRIGTRGSDLAMRQTRAVVASLAEFGASAEIVVIQTQGDREADAPMTPGVWATGAFVSEIERALAAGEIDLAVHSHKDLASVSLPGLVVVATPPRAPAHDVLVAASAEVAEACLAVLENGDSMPDLAIGTSSPRRAAQLRRALGCRIEPIRGNVPTRIAKAGADGCDAVCLAAAGIERLGLAPAHMVPLPLDRFPTAPAQGAVAVQSRSNTPAAAIAARLDHEPTHRCVHAERAFLATINAGCHAPIAASAAPLADGRSVELHVQLFRDDGDLFEERARSADAPSLGRELGERALAWIRT